MAHTAHATRTRFAPSPTGDLHLGGAYVALASWWLARRHAGAFVLRMEDLDPPRVVAGSAARILEDLAWLGLSWDEEHTQSARGDRYTHALASLHARGLTYVCDCSRAEIARVASAPHAGEELVYPGTCRDADPDRVLKRLGAVRLRVPHERVVIEDGVAGTFAQDLAADVGDFVLQRGDGVIAYQLAVTVDDVEMGITDVVRGVDLLPSTPRQAFLARLLGHEPPRTWHLPLVVDAQGARLAKRTAGAHLRTLRESGVGPEEVLGELGHALGLRASSDPCTLQELLETPIERWPPRSGEGWRIPARWAALEPASDRGAAQEDRNER
jgi:glutamyl-tRNA synthetase